MSGPSGFKVSTLVQEGELLASEIWPTCRRHDVFTRTKGRRGKTIDVARVMDRLDENRATVRQYTLRRRFLLDAATLIMLDDGSIYTERDASKRMQRVFEPPMLYAPARLAAGDVGESTFGVRINTRGGASEIPVSGKARVEGLGVQAIMTGIGEVRCFVMQSVVEIGTGLSDSRQEYRLWIDQSGRGLGIVATEWRDKGTYFGIPLGSSAKVSVIKTNDAPEDEQDG